MIKQVLATAALIFMFTLQGAAQSNLLYIVINEASWCKYCKANGARIHKLIDDYALNNKVLVLSNDVTDYASKKVKIPKFKEIGIYDYMIKHREAAVVFVFDAQSKKLVDKFSIKIDNDKILTHLNKVMEGVKDS